jgi:hypothetical protein
LAKARPVIPTPMGTTERDNADALIAWFNQIRNAASHRQPFHGKFLKKYSWRFVFKQLPEVFRRFYRRIHTSDKSEFL